jgi:hypothetical protein
MNEKEKEWEEFQKRVKKFNEQRDILGGYFTTSNSIEVIISSETGFEPLSDLYSIDGTSYRFQLGMINQKWASRLVKGSVVIDIYVYKDEEVENGFPNQDTIVSWILRATTVNFNPFEIKAIAQFLLEQANDKLRKLNYDYEYEAATIPPSSLSDFMITDGDELDKNICLTCKYFIKSVEGLYIYQKEGVCDKDGMKITEYFRCKVWEERI